MWRVSQLAMLVDRQRLRVLQLVRRWSEVVGQQMNLELQRLRQLELEVRVHRMHRLRQARLRVLQWSLTVDLHLRQLVQQGRQPQMREHLAMRQLRSLVRQLERRRCTLEAVSMTLWLQPRRPLAMLEDRRQLRLRQRRRRSRRQTLGIVGTMRAVMRLRRRVVVAGALWCTTRRAWVRPRWQREAHQVMQVRRLAGKRCEVVRARWTLPRQQVWQLVRRW